MSDNPRVTGIGGIFFKTVAKDETLDWYRSHLGIDWQGHGFKGFRWRDAEHPERVGQTVLSPFPADTDYFSPGDAEFMINFRVDDLDAVLAALRAEGVWVADEVQDFGEYGRFGWCSDNEGRKIELWEPPAGEVEPD